MITNVKNHDSDLSFTLSGVDVSVANAIRRVILSDIPTVVFETFPHERNQATFHTNTSHFTNEILKQRLSCIPVHVKDIQSFLDKNYELEVNVENITDTTIYVTTEDFVVVKDGKALPEAQIREIFPPNSYTGDFIDFVRLRPKLAEGLQGDKVHFTAKFSKGTARESGMYSVASTCSYGFTPDEVKINTELAKKKQIWKDEGKNEGEIEFEKNNWLLLDAKRIYVENSFDFVLQSIGVFTNEELLVKACEVIINGLKSPIAWDENVRSSKSTMENSFDLTLPNVDFTLGKLFEYMLCHKYFIAGDKTLTFCCFTKLHPHSTSGLLRIAFKDPSDKSILRKYMEDSILDLTDIFEKVIQRVQKDIKN